MNEKYLYIIFASTPYKIGKMIRRITGDTYNHACIALDENLEQMYGFARRYYHTPLYGGFVRESISRYHVNGESAQMRVCRIPVTEEQYKTLSQLLADMLKRQEHYIYNHLSALCALFHKPLKIKDAFICVEFVVHILHSVGIPLDPNHYYSVGDLEALMRPYEFYTGPAPDTEIIDTTYYAQKPLPHPIITTFCAIFELFERLFE